MGDISVSDADMEAVSDREQLERFWQALIDGNDRQAAQFYADDAVLLLPQSGEKLSGREAIVRGLVHGDMPSQLNGIVGRDGLWVTECETHAPRAMLLISVARMDNGRIVHETRYLAPRQLG